MKEFWNIIQMIFTAVGGWLGWFLGGCDGLLYALIAFVTIDYITGVMAAAADHKLSSEVGFKGICRKVLIFLLVGIGHIDAKAVNDLIAQNARVAQNQTEYNERYEALVSRYEETERRRDELADRINQIMIRRRKLERFIETVEGLPELYTEFDAGQWAALVDSMTVHAKDQITFTLTCGMEIEA